MRSKFLTAAMLAAVSPMTIAQHDLVRQPIVVYQGIDTVPVAPYLSILMSEPRQRSSQPSGLDRQREGVVPMVQTIPFESEAMQPGKPTFKLIEGMYRPLFIMGMDSISLDWLALNAELLGRLAATGAVVQAKDKADWQRLRDKAREVGISLTLLDGDSLAAAYSVTRYPVLFVSRDTATRLGL